MECTCVASACVCTLLSRGPRDAPLLLLQASGPCNLAMPNNPSVYVRYLWYVRLLTYNGFVVLVDNHLNSDPTITKDVNLWVKARHSRYRHCSIYVTEYANTYVHDHRT
jgi:hypothetical protein